MSGRRLATGGLIDRMRPLAFSFDGRPYTGFAGDTLASALLAAGAGVVARSFKYHRPRGALTAGPEEPSALVTLRQDGQPLPNARATTVELHDGLEAWSQNRWPSLALDVGAVNGLASALIPAGFYYKTFMWPAAFWERVYEPLIRRAAGLGALGGEADASTYDRDHAFADVLVVGAGSAGLCAALAAGRAGARVLLAEQDARLGGRLLAEDEEIDGRPGPVWVAEVEAELRSLPNVRVFARTAVFGAYDGGVFGAMQRLDDGGPAGGGPRQRYWRIVARACVLAAGATERPLVFGGNDRPGVMAASAVRANLHRFGVAAGGRVAVYATGEAARRTAADLRAAGVDVAAVIDPAADATPLSGERHICGGRVAGTLGSPALFQVKVEDAHGKLHRVAADALATAGGWSPNVGLAGHFGARAAWSATAGAYVVQAPPPGMRIAGSAAGRFTLAQALADGGEAGRIAAADAGFDTPSAPPSPCRDHPTETVPTLLPGRTRGKAFVDFQHDVTDKDVALAVREGFTSVEHLKRYTTLGMATDQGRTSAANGHALLAATTGRGLGEVGAILSRPPDVPVAIGALAGAHRGAHYRPVRLTPTHAWARARGASFVDAGPWKRAQWFARGGESWRQAVDREVRAVRGDVGFCDVSTLGKIEVVGADAGAFLDFVYANTFSTLKVGRARYGLMLREDGIAMDDGTVSRLSDERFLATTTTANAVRVMQHLEFVRQVLKPGLDVRLTSVTDQWAQLAVAGPRSREVLASLLEGAADVSNDALSYMGCCAFRWRGAAARLYRLSFSGELAYELAVPARHGEALARALAEAGATPYGVEALGVMRIEKGHPAGPELNGTTTAADLGMGGLMSTKKDFIGRVLAQRAGMVDPNRPRLVGLRPLDAAAPLRAGAHLLPPGAPTVAAQDLGWVSSSAWSPTLERPVALAFVRGGAERAGETLRAYDPVRGGDALLEVVHPASVDPAGERLRG